MVESLYSSSWYRVENLRPMLRSHARIQQQYYRGDLWYVLRDLSSDKTHRLSPEAHAIVGRMDGKRTVAQLWEAANRRHGEKSPTQEEVIRLLSTLHSADALVSGLAPDARELQTRYERKLQQNRKMKFTNPMALRFGLLDPEKILQRWRSLIDPLFSLAGLVVWALVVIGGLILAGMHWQGLTQNVADRVLSPDNLLIMLLVFPVLKLFHEFGHAFAVKRWGGEVHDMGIILLVLFPVPYVDATASWAFREKHRRVIVGAAGMMAELFLAAVAMALWVALEPGLMRSVCYNILLISGVSTLVFNGNPLLRFDGYYILQDLLEIPNLATRSNQHLGYLVQKYLFRIERATAVATAPGEAHWFVFYGIAAFFYRMLVAVVIIGFVAGKFFTLGLLLSVWVATTMLLQPLYKRLRFLMDSPLLDGRRFHAVAMTGLGICALLVLLFLIPVPHYTTTEGVIWLSEDAHVRMETSGFIQEVVATPGAAVRTGDLLILVEEPELETEAMVLSGRLREIDARMRIQQVDDYLEAQITEQDYIAISKTFARVRERQKQLTLRSPADGIFVLPLAHQLLGRYLNQGEALAYVLREDMSTVRVVVSQANVDLVRRQTRAVQVRLAEDMGEVYRAQLQREVPAATANLPSSALSHAGGGSIANNPNGANPGVAFEKVFEFELLVPRLTEMGRSGGRVYVRFDHGYSPLASQWYRGLKQSFLRLLHA